MRLAAVIDRSGADITELVQKGEYILSKEASECVESILSGIRKSECPDKTVDDVSA